jgi:hypothetical protein
MGVTESHKLKQEIRRILDCQATAEPSLEFEKWRLVHKFVHAHHIAVPARPARSEPRREAANKTRDMLGQGPRSARPI